MMKFFKKIFEMCNNALTGIFKMFKRNHKFLCAVIGIYYALSTISAIYTHSVEISDIKTLFEYFVSIIPEI